MLTTHKVCRLTLMASCLALMAPFAVAQGVSQITVHVDHPGPKISPMFYGLMTEEINHAYDGGLYAELIQNRGLRDSDRGPIHWSVVKSGSGTGFVVLDNDPTDRGLNLKLSATVANSNDRVGLANDGYWGIPSWPNTTYQLSFYAKASAGLSGPLTATIETNDEGKVLAQTTISGLTTGWKKYTATLKTGSVPTSNTNRFVISLPGAGTVWFRSISLFPPTYKHRKNGNRIDLMEKMAEMNPSFLRMPGGNYLEGNTIPERFDWKATIGDVSKRFGHQGPWGYRSSDGLGLLEFLEWCEDLHMQPVLAVFAGYALQGAHIDPGPGLQPYVQDALDEIEYLTGGPNTVWGARRIKDGHPKPFPFTYVEIGNEDGFDRSGSYDGRYAQFHDAIKAKYPKLQIIATAPVKTRKPDVIDDHYYRSAAEMERDSGHYDRYDRKGPKIFVGEWASIEGNQTPTHQAALGDAAWLIGLERNSDLVVMEAYAPLLINMNPKAAQWPTNLIGYDATKSFGSPSFYVQSMFGKNTGDTVLPTTVKVATATKVKPFVPHGKVGLGTWRTDSEYKDIEVTHNGETLYKKDFAEGTSGWGIRRGSWKVEGDSLRQTTMEDDTHASAGDAKWTDYTYHLKAKKLGGEEGFLVLFHVQNSQNYMQWNIGGWGNSRSAIQQHANGDVHEVGRATGTTVETGRWYDIKIVTSGTHVKFYLDDKLITQITETDKPIVSPLYAGASRVSRTGEIIVKVVNVSGEPIFAQLNLDGLVGSVTSGEGWVLVGKPEDQNSIAEPKKVAPHKIRVGDVPQHMTRTYLPYSVTVLRLKTQG